MMGNIQFTNVVPEVFRGTELKSDIWNADVTIERGKLYLVEAESGRGKSTFCSYVQGYRRDYSGRILFDGHDIRQFNTGQWSLLRQRSLSTLFQELRLFPELTALENVEIKNNLTRHKSEADIRQWFERLGIADKLDSRLALMSFGQQQRVALIRALCQPFDFLLADEPISHLDGRNASIMGEIMMEEARQQGAGIIVTSIGKHIDLPYDVTFKL